MNDFFDGNDKRRQFDDLLAKILRDILPNEAPFEELNRLCIEKYKSRLEIQTIHIRKEKEKEKKEKDRAYEESRKRKASINEKYNSSLEAAINKLIKEQESDTYTINFKKQLESKLISSEKRQPLSRYFNLAIA